MSVHVIVRFTVDPADLDAFDKGIPLLCAKTRTEPGVVAYDFYQDRNDAGAWSVHEAFADAAAFLAHIDNVGEAGAATMSLMHIHDTVVWGDMPREIIERMERKRGRPVHHYGATIATLAPAPKTPLEARP